MKEYKVIALSGDGIGPEVVSSAMKVLETIMDNIGGNCSIEYRPIGGVSYDEFGLPLTNEVLRECKYSDAVFLGAVGGPKWDDLPQKLKPEKALLDLRKELNLFSNIRPAKVYESLLDASSLKPEKIKGSDIIVVRELTGGIYFGEPRGKNEHKSWNTLIYTKEEISRISIVAFELARKRSGHLTSVHKSNVLESSQFWKDIVTDIHKDYKDVELVDMYVDNAAMQLVRDPSQFDVIVTQNLFGDILSDISAMITGSLGMLPSASIGLKHAMYEPVHGSAPEIAGKNIANPIASIASVAMMLDHTFGLSDEANKIYESINTILSMGFRTVDISDNNSNILSTTDMTEMIVKQLKG